MQVVIDLPEDLYNRIFKGLIALNSDDVYELQESVELSIRHKVLPEGHGRLIDADALASEIKDLKKSPWYKDNTNLAYLPRKEAVEIIEEIIVGDAPTIIEADKVTEDEN